MKYDLSVFQEPRGVMRIFQFVSIYFIIVYIMFKRNITWLNQQINAVRRFNYRNIFTIFYDTLNIILTSYIVVNVRCLVEI